MSNKLPPRHKAAIEALNERDKLEKPQEGGCYQYVDGKLVRAVEPDSVPSDAPALPDEDEELDNAV